MYEDRDFREADHHARRWELRLSAVLAPLIALYVLGIVRGIYALMLAALLLGFVACVAICDLALLPALRYRHFLRQLRSGLRRETRCRLLYLEEKAQTQDGALVRALHVALEDGDERIFYINDRKADQLARMGQQVCLHSCGRHVVDCVRI